MIKKIKRHLINNMPDKLFAFMQNIIWSISAKYPSIKLKKEKDVWSAIYKAEKIYFPTPRTAILGHFLETQSSVFEKEFIINDGDIVIDIGAYVGSFSLLATRRKANLIIAIEPNPYSFKCLKLNTQLNDNIICKNMGVWNTKENLIFFIDKKYPIADSLVIPPINHEKINIKVDTLDNIINEYKLQTIDFVKMNIEGAEIEALQGMDKTLKITKKIVIDAHHVRENELTIPKVLELLERYGFKLMLNNDTGTVYGHK